MFVLDMSDKRPIYEQIVDRMKELISLGVFRVDEKIPSVRQLAIDLSINPNTIQKAYAELERTGFIYTVKGRGNFAADIAKLLPEMQREFYAELDEVLGRAGNVSLSEDDIVRHVRDYYHAGDSSNR